MAIELLPALLASSASTLRRLGRDGAPATGDCEQLDMIADFVESAALIFEQAPSVVESQNALYRAALADGGTGFGPADASLTQRGTLTEAIAESFAAAHDAHDEERLVQLRSTVERASSLEVELFAAVHERVRRESTVAGPNAL